MKQNGFHCVLIASILLDIGLARRAAGADQPIEIGDGVSQMFIDDALIASQKNVKRTLHQPVKENGGNAPVISLDQEFGKLPGTLQANGTIVFDEKLKKYVMLALAYSPAAEVPPADKVRIYRFTSPDAMNWTKGDDGKPQRIAVDLLDKKSGTSATNTDLFSFCYDKNDSAEPYKGWLYFANWGDEREGIYYFHSHDGVTWQRGQKIMSRDGRKIEQDGRTLLGIGDVTTFYQDSAIGRYLALIKFTAPKLTAPGNQLRSRAYLFVDRLDQPVDLQKVNQVNLVPAAADAKGDQPSDEYYASGAWRYQSLWLGELKIWHGAGDYAFSAAGSAFLKLVVSHDGLHWTKVSFANEAGQPEVFVANGPEGGNNAHNDGGYITLFSQGPLRMGNELIYYYGSSSYGKNHPRDIRLTGGGIFRARMRLDGFVSVDEGVLSTRPIKFKGDDLFVNSAGMIEVSVVDDHDSPLASATLRDDSTANRVLFNGKSLKQIAADGTARLKFSVGNGGHLYSFTCR